MLHALYSSPLRTFEIGFLKRYEQLAGQFSLILATRFEIRHESVFTVLPRRHTYELLKPDKLFYESLKIQQGLDPMLAVGTVTD